MFISFELTQFTNVTDRQRDRQTDETHRQIPHDGTGRAYA